MGMKRVLVVGSEGNIGSRLVPYLESMKYDVYCADIQQKYRDKYFLVDINIAGDVYRMFSEVRPGIVVNLSAMVSRVTCERSPHIAVDTNLSGLNNVMQATLLAGAKFIYFSTSEVYGNIGGILSEDRKPEPNNRYGLTKYLGEKLVEYEIGNGLDAIIVRPFMFYDENETFGDNRSAMIRFAHALVSNSSAERPITVHRGAKRSWMHMLDGVRAIERTFHYPSLMPAGKSDIFNIGHPRIYGMEELAKMMCDHLGLAYSACVHEENIPRRMTLEKIPDVGKQIRMLGVTPEISLEEGVRRVIDTVRKRLA